MSFIDTVNKEKKNQRFSLLIEKLQQMSTTTEKGLRPSRVQYPSGIDLNELCCPICLNILWRPVACQSCESPFCSTCISKTLQANSGQCPMKCYVYKERACPPFIFRQLAKMRIDCIFQSNGCKEILPYEGLERHESQCGYQCQQCPGCRQKILKKDFTDHKAQCPLIELTCSDCKLVYQRRDAIARHTEAVCLKIQMKQMRHEVEENKRQVTAMQELLFTEKITFADISHATMEPAPLPTRYKKLIWNNINYVHKQYLKEKYPNSGYMTAITHTDSSYIAFTNSSASIAVKPKEDTFGIVSLWVCAAWIDNLSLTITGHRKSVKIYEHTTTLLRGQPSLIQLCWTDIDLLKFEPSRKSNFILTCLTVSRPNEN